MYAASFHPTATLDRFRGDELYIATYNQKANYPPSAPCLSAGLAALEPEARTQSLQPSVVPAGKRRLGDQK